MASSATESVVATTISLIRAAWRKRSTTRARTVLPPISITTLPGKRGLSIRAWIIAAIFTALLPFASRRRLPLEVRQNFAQCANYIFNITGGHAVKHWQADQAFISSLSYGILPAFVTKAITIVRMTMNRDVVNVHANIFRA